MSFQVAMSLPGSMGRALHADEGAGAAQVLAAALLQTDKCPEWTN